MLIGDDACEPFCVEPADDIRGLNAAIDCDTPSAKMNCSRSSMFVRPLANGCHDRFYRICSVWIWIWLCCSRFVAKQFGKYLL